MPHYRVRREMYGGGTPSSPPCSDSVNMYIVKLRRTRRHTPCYVMECILEVHHLGHHAENHATSCSTHCYNVVHRVVPRNGPCSSGGGLAAISPGVDQYAASSLHRQVGNKKGREEQRGQRRVEIF